MAKAWDEKLANLSEKLNDLSRKAAEASEDAKAYRELRQEVIEDKISTVKGNVAAMQENARLAEEARGRIMREMTARFDHKNSIVIGFAVKDQSCRIQMAASSGISWPGCADGAVPSASVIPS